MFKFAHRLASLAIYTGLCLGFANTISPITSPVNTNGQVRLISVRLATRQERKEYES